MLTRREFAAGCASALLCPAGTVRAGGELSELTLAAAGSLLRSASISPVELVESCLARIAALDPVLNTFITLTGDEALATARERTAELARGQWRGPLHGIPLALKDNLDTAGTRTTAASAAMQARIPAADAEVVRRLKAAGAILLGKLNMDDCAYGISSTTGYFGEVRNPWHTDYSAGGSSGGPAAAVAARLCFAALGTDTGGSIRQPAAWCGVTGLKPSYGLVSNRGVIPLSWSMDHVGPLCRTAEDAAILLQVIAGHDAADPTSLHFAALDYPAASQAETSTLRLGRVSSMFEGLDPEVDAALASALEVLAELTAGIAGIELPAVPRLSLMFVESASYFGPEIARDPESFSAELRTLVASGQQISATRYAEDRRQLELARRSVEQLFRGVDLLVSPTTPDLPLSIAASREPPTGFGPPVSARNTTPFNVFGLPSISVPCGFSRSGLPIGLQISGPAGGDAQVLAMARAYQARTAWHERRPGTAS